MHSCGRPPDPLGPLDNDRVTVRTTWESLREMCSCADVMGPTDAITPLAEIAVNKVEKLIVVVRAARQSCQPIIAFLAYCRPVYFLWYRIVTVYVSRTWPILTRSG